jgi:hypothetical protein
MLVYISILVLVSFAAVTLMLSMRSLFDSYRSDQKLNDAAKLAMDRIIFAVRDADIIDTTDPDLVLVDTPGHLTLLRGSTTTEFYVASGTLMVSENSAKVGPLTGSDVTVDELRFIKYDNAVTEAIRIKMILSVVFNGATTTATFYDGAVLRGTYD